MSQQKVDKRKQEKYNRKQQMRKNKIERIVYGTVGTVAAIAVCGWIGFSVYSKTQADKPASYTQVNMDAVNDYLGTLDTAAE